MATAAAFNTNATTVNESTVCRHPARFGHGVPRVVQRTDDVSQGDGFVIEAHGDGVRIHVRSHRVDGIDRIHGRTGRC